MAIDNALLETMVQRIVDNAHPSRIILFGSQARGEASAVSDVDLLVITDEPFGPNNSRFAAMGRLYHALARMPVATDILLFSRDEVEGWSTSLNHVVACALREGRVLYAR